MFYIRTLKNTILFIPIILFLAVSLYLRSAIIPRAPQSSDPDQKIIINHSKEIVFGQSAFLTGAGQLYGTTIRNAIDMYFQRINEKGGIRGKMLRIISLDDKDSPEQAKENIDYLIKNGVSMLIGNTGTRNIRKILPAIKEGTIAMFFPWAGAPALRNPDLRYIVNGPGFLLPQFKKIIEFINKEIKDRDIAILHTDGEFATREAKVLTQELARYGMKPVISVKYNRHTLHLEEIAQKIRNQDPEIVICISLSMPMVRLISNFFKNGDYATAFFGIDSTLFVSTIMEHVGIDFHYSSLVPDPASHNIPIVNDYNKDLERYYPHEIPNILSLTYYISAAIIVDAMKNIPDKTKITKEAIINEIEKMKDYNLKGFVVNFNANNRHAYGNDAFIIKG